MPLCPAVRGKGGGWASSQHVELSCVQAELTPAPEDRLLTEMQTLAIGRLHHGKGVRVDMGRALTWIGWTFTTKEIQ